MQLYLIRHAESQNNARPVHNRVEDPTITPVGHLQAEHLAGWMKSLKFDHLITSPFKRTLQTTRYVFDVTDHTVHVWHHVFEQGGCFKGFGPDAKEGAPGLGRTSVVDHFPADRCIADETISEQGWWFGKQRETPQDHSTRVTSVIDRINQTFGDSEQVVTMVVHAQFERELLHQLVPHASIPQLGFIKNCSITKLNNVGNNWQLDWFNSITHMPAKLITGSEI
ncbi:phosphoglycerate mutase [Rubripirellula obstinata]|uniref:Phosphoglycerate mutase n=1 Tax=Rubripirellula obstinata TaxID=406547 RepID=A0A5B1CEY7_9BACT|nr:histidine phosphatase family protein [Rubripirellula obstinata]KAA1258791.1 phosphoglycerate mutase [Rubripirellula obstinata]